MKGAENGDHIGLLIVQHYEREGGLELVLYSNWKCIIHSSFEVGVEQGWRMGVGVERDVSV